MQKTLKFGSIALAALLAVTAIAALVPSAEAQVPTQAPATVSMKITPFDGPIKPLSGLGQAKISVNYQHFAAGNLALAATPVHLKVTESPSWAVVTISPATLLFPIKGGAPGGGNIDEGSLDATILVTTTADAPAFQAANIKIQAVADANQPIAGYTTEEQTIVQSDYFSIIDVQVAQPIRLVRPQTAVDFPVTITNFGNGNSKVAFELVGDPSGGLTVPIPNPVTLEARQTGGKVTQQTVSFSVSTPFKNGYMNVPGLVTAKLKAQYALNTQIHGDEVQFSILATTRGFYVPGPGFLTVLGALAVAVGMFAAFRPRVR